LNPFPNRVPQLPSFPNPTLNGTEDFALFYLRALTNTTGGGTPNPALAAAQLQAFYPGLVIVGNPVPYFTNAVVTNFATTTVNLIGAPAGTPPQTVTYVNGVFTNRVARYNYVFGNLMINSNDTFYPFTVFNGNQSPINPTSGLYTTNDVTTNVTVVVGPKVGSPFGTLSTNVSS